MEKKALKITLFGAFLACLYVSIPHLAWVFYSWENAAGAGTPLSLSLFGMDVLTTKQEWLNAYLQAMSIDVIIAFLSYTLTNSKSLGFKGLGYTFVGLLILLSWFFNWLYAKAHAPVMADSSIWGQTFLWGIVSIKRITPIINSSLPVFAFAFTVMIDRLTGEQMTAAEIEAKATEAENVNNALGKLRKAKNERAAERIKGIFGLAKQVKDQGKELLSGEESADGARTENHTFFDDECDTGPITDPTQIDDMSVLLSADNRNTDELEVARTDSRTQKHTEDRTNIRTENETESNTEDRTQTHTKARTGDAHKRALRVLRKYPEIRPGDLAKKAQISETYARKILAELGEK